MTPYEQGILAEIGTLLDAGNCGSPEWELCRCALRDCYHERGDVVRGDIVHSLLGQETPNWMNFVTDRSGNSDSEVCFCGYGWKLLIRWGHASTERTASCELTPVFYRRKLP